MNVEIRELSMEETVGVAGGYDDNDWCGTRPHFPRPRPVLLAPIDLVGPIMVGGHG